MHVLIVNIRSRSLRFSVDWCPERRSLGVRSHSIVLTVSGTSRMLGERAFAAAIVGLAITISRPPHQIMTWVGLERYGYLEDAQRLAYRFLYM
jgi:hypothetical protein